MCKYVSEVNSVSRLLAPRDQRQKVVLASHLFVFATTYLTGMAVYVTAYPERAERMWTGREFAS